MASNSEGEHAAIGCLAILLMLPFSILFRAFVLTRLWTWFLVPLGLPSVGLAHAYGLSVLVAMFTQHATHSDKDMEEKGIGYVVCKLAGNAFGLPLLMWFIGWICYCAM